MLCFVNIFNTRKRKHNFFFENVNISNILQFFKTSQKRKMFGVKVVPIDVINHPLQYGGKKLGHPVYGALMLLKFFRNWSGGLEFAHFSLFSNFEKFQFFGIISRTL